LSSLGLDRASAGIRVFAAAQFAEPAGFPSIGVRGCYMSHLTLIEHCAQSGKSAMIFEDDVHFNLDGLERSPSLAEQVANQHWDIIYFGNVLTLVPGSVALELFTGELPCLHWYGISPSFAARLAPYLRDSLKRETGHPEGGRIHVDGAINDFRRKNPDVVALRCNPSLAGQFASRTDLGMEKWFDNVPVVRDLVERVRSLKSGV
jgi:hypothetical protein